MYKELIKKAFHLGYLAGLEKRGIARVLGPALVHTVPGVVAGYGSDSVNKDPNKYWEKGKKYTTGGILAALASAGLLATPLAPLAPLGLLGGGVATAYGTNSAIASAIAKHRKNKT